MLVLVADDDRAVREALERALQLAGYDVELASDGDAALAAIAKRTPDAVVLDVMMPGYDGLDVTRRLRREGNRVPVLLLTARDAVGDRVDGLDAGADDYLPKPFALEELLARLRALLRRAVEAEPADVLRFADLTFDLGAMEARRAGRRFELTTTEAHLLELFMRNPRQVLPRPLIYERVWGYDFSHSSNALDVYVGYLRRKTETEDEPRLIHPVRDTTIRGVHAREVVAPILNGGGAVIVARSLQSVDHELHRLQLILVLVSLGGIAVAAAAGALVSRATLAPVRRLTGAAERIAETGDPSERVEASGRGELARLGTAFNTMLAALEESLETQRRFV